MANINKLLFIVYRLSELFSGHGEPVPISGVIGHQDRIHPGRRANPSQGTHTQDNLEMPINIQCMSLARGGKPEYPEETPRHRENMQTPHTHSGGGNRTPNPGAFSLIVRFLLSALCAHDHLRSLLGVTKCK
ncbi:hypothetical protein QTP70_030831 [Hemibagrus guttatus]|uniref:Uncharacterized protein n=1 Tax=Hemibagrus guttatus TaxID=175788 RepID=A0AAE0PTC5_9TELE|nr:hypothetical protein QTP70_030831 [Hemibagrus guttatus]